jgi:hypothetical protein
MPQEARIVYLYDRACMKKLIVLVMVVVVFLFGNAMAQEKVQINVKQEGDVAAVQSEGVTAIRLAEELVRYGQHKTSPTALILAAQILLENPLSALEAKRQEEAGQASPAVESTKTGGTAPVLDPARLLTEAQSMAAAMRRSWPW